MSTPTFSQRPGKVAFDNFGRQGGSLESGQIAEQAALLLLSSSAHSSGFLLHITTERELIGSPDWSFSRRMSEIIVIELPVARLLSKVMWLSDHQNNIL